MTLSTCCVPDMTGIAGLPAIEQTVLIERVIMSRRGSCLWRSSDVDTHLQLGLKAKRPVGLFGSVLDAVGHRFFGCCHLRHFPVDFVVWLDFRKSLAGYMQVQWHIKSALK